MSQKDDILKYLQQGHTLTPAEALDLFGCARLAARIWDIQRDHAVTVEMIEVETRAGVARVARYSLADEQSEYLFDVIKPRTWR